MTGRDIYYDLKHTIMWFAILCLSLYVHAHWMEAKHQDRARERWMDKSTLILGQVASYAGEAPMIDMDVDELANTVDDVLDNIVMLSYDEDFQRITEQEQSNFIALCYEVAFSFQQKFKDYREENPDLFAVVSRKKRPEKHPASAWLRQNHEELPSPDPLK